MKRVRLSGKYRLITRSDFDGLICGMLFQESGLADRILFAHPKDLQDGTVDVDSRDIIAGLPYVPGCAITFDHADQEGISEEDREEGFFVCDARMPSISRLVYSWLGGRLAFPRIDQSMLQAADKIHSSQFTSDEILNPTGWILLSFLMDARSGLARFKDFRLNNYQLMMELIPFFSNRSIIDLLKHPDVQERIEVFQQNQQPFIQQIQRCTKVHGRVGVLDLRNEETIWAGNRFAIYALFPQISASIHVLWGLRRQYTVFAAAKSILNPTTHDADIGALMAQFGGNGQPSTGSCQIPSEDAEQVLASIINSLK
jgi:hypothetical protein